MVKPAIKALALAMAEEVRSYVSQAFSAAGERITALEARIAALPAKGDHGKDADPETLRLIVFEQVTKAVAALPRAEPGRDAAQLDILPAIDPAKSYPRGTWASHQGGLVRAARQTDAVQGPGGLGAAGWVVMVEGLAAVSVTQDGDRQFTIATILTSGAKALTVFQVPVLVYREIWREGEYQRGDVVTWAGSAWHCQQQTTDKPGTSGAWRLMVKSGGPPPKPDAVRAPAPQPVRLR